MTDKHQSTSDDSGTMRALISRIVNSYVDSPMLIDELCHALSAHAPAVTVSSRRVEDLALSYASLCANNPTDKVGLDKAWRVLRDAIRALEASAPVAEIRGKLNRFMAEPGKSCIYDHLDQADVLIRIDGDFESDADREQYVNALAARLQAPAPAPEPWPGYHADIAAAIGELSQAMGSPTMMARRPASLLSATVRAAAERIKAQASEPAPTLDTIYAAWRAIGADVAGLEWSKFAALLPGAQAPAVEADSAKAEGPAFYLVLSPNGKEGVAFTDKADALYTATGKRSGFGVSTIGEAFREAYDEADSFETIEVRAASQPPVQGGES